MRTLGWTLTGLGLAVASFVAMFVLDASLPQAYNLTDPQIWLGAVVLGGSGLASLAYVLGDERQHVLQGSAIGIGVCVLLVGGFYAIGTGSSMSVYAQRSDGEPVATLDPNRTYQQAPELARALDELVRSNASEVLVTQDEETFDRIERYLNERTGAYTRPVAWRGTVVSVQVEAV